MDDDAIRKLGDQLEDFMEEYGIDALAIHGRVKVAARRLICAEPTKTLGLVTAERTTAQDQDGLRVALVRLVNALRERRRCP